MMPGPAMPIIGAAPPKLWNTTLIICILAGFVGGHRFYVGKTGTGIAMLCTLGGCGVWTVIDLFMIITGKFTDKYGQPLLKT